MGIFTDFITDVAILVEDVVDVVKDNPVKTTAIVATTVATGGLSLVAAPTIAAAAGGAGRLGAARQVQPLVVCQVLLQLVHL